MDEIDEACRRLIAIGCPTGHGENWKDLALECIATLERLDEQRWEEIIEDLPKN